MKNLLILIITSSCAYQPSYIAHYCKDDFTYNKATRLCERELITTSFKPLKPKKVQSIKKAPKRARIDCKQVLIDINKCSM